MDSINALAMKVSVRNALAAAGVTGSDAVELFIRSNRGRLQLDDNTDELLIDGQPAAGQFATNPALVSGLKSPAIKTMTKSAFNAAMLAGTDLGDMTKILLVDDGSTANNSGIVTPLDAQSMNRADYRAAMIRGDQGLDKITMLTD